MKEFAEFLLQPTTNREQSTASELVEVLYCLALDFDIFRRIPGNLKKWETVRSENTKKGYQMMGLKRF